MPAQEPELPDSQIEIPEPTDHSTGKGWPATVIVSIAAVAVTALVGILGVINTRNSQFYEEEKSEREFRLSCVASAATIAQMAFALSKDFSSMPDNEKINQINIIIASFPPDTASRFLGALAPRMGNAQAVIRAFQVAQNNSISLVEAYKRLACPSAPQLIGTNDATTDPTPQSTPQPPQPQTSPSSAVTAPSPSVTPPVKPKLTIYYQITQRADLNYANMIAKGIADATDLSPSFPSAGVELVPAARPLGQTEIRYYRPDQDAAAQDLLEQLLTEAKGKSLNLSARTVYIGAKYPNLPPGRMEVWFQPLTLAHQG
jgi:hypothetical protein